MCIKCVCVCACLRRFCRPVIKLSHRNLYVSSVPTLYKLNVWSMIKEISRCSECYCLCLCLCPCSCWIAVKLLKSHETTHTHTTAQSRGHFSRHSKESKQNNTQNLFTIIKRRRVMARGQMHRPWQKGFRIRVVE